MYDFDDLLGYSGMESIDLPEETISDDIFLLESESVDEIEADDLFFPDIVQQNEEENNFLKRRSK